MSEDRNLAQTVQVPPDLYELIVSNTREFAIFGVDLDGTITSWNPGVEYLFGYSRVEFIGQPAALIFTAEDKEKGAPKRELLGAQTQGEAMDVRWHLRKDGSRFWANGVLTSLRSPAGELVGYAKVVRDETEKKRFEMERDRLLVQLREERDLVNGLNALLEQRVSEGLLELASTSTQLDQEALERQKVERSAGRLSNELQSQSEELESITYSISHDLRAPLRGLDGFSQALLEDYGDVLDETGKSYLRRVRTGAQLIGELIDNLLDLSRLSYVQMRREEVNLSEVAGRIADRLRESSPEREMEFLIPQGIMAQGDANMLAVVLENLLSNAWKFTSKEERARIEFGANLEDGETTYFVRDNGVGFDMRYSGRLFAPFQRLHPNREFEGTGVGLATVRRIVRRHGGRVRAEAQVGQGATFFFTL
ncbi:MAG: ATP-binding protein [Trueperaceae bacterium]